MTTHSRALAFGLLVVAGACGSDVASPTPTTPSTPSTPSQPTQPTDPSQPSNPGTPTTPANPTSSYTLLLGSSAASPAVGQTITLWLVAKREAASAKVGSFKATIVPDTTAIGFVAQIDRTTDGLVALNSQTTGPILVAGAAASGFGNDTVASWTMTVKKSGGLSTLTLIVNEIVTAAFEDKTAGASTPRP